MAASNKDLKTKIDSLIPDDLNANKGTEYGSRLLIVECVDIMRLSVLF